MRLAEAEIAEHFVSETEARRVMDELRPIVFPDDDDRANKKKMRKKKKKRKQEEKESDGQR